MLKRIYEKNKIVFAVLWIAIYCVLMSLGDALSEVFGVKKSVTLAVALLLSAVLIFFLKKNGLFSSYGITRPHATAKSMLYYLPVIAMLTANFWCGATLKHGISETVLHILTMLLVGFLEEVIFRGLLFEAMRKDSPVAAVIVSSITFGFGHIINLVNGSGAELVPNLLQIVYATAAGFMFVMIYLKSKSLVVCIASHGLFNAMSAFSGESASTFEAKILSALLLTAITGGYAIYLAVSLKTEKM